MTRTKLRLLLLSVGSLVGQRVIDALGTRRERCVLIGTNSIAEAAGNFRCDTVHLVASAASGAVYIERVAELIRDEEPDLVIPCRDDDILALALLGEQWRPGSAVLLAGGVAAARMFNDKVESARFASRHGLPYAPTATRVDEAIELTHAHGLPLIGKPRAGYGSRGVVLLRSISEIERAFYLNPELIAQPFLDPPSNMNALIAPFDTGLPFFFSFPETRQYVVQLVVGPDGSISTAFGCLGTMVGGQNIQYARCDDPDLLEVGRAYARAAVAEGWKGPLSVQLKRTAGGLLAHEVNARFTGGTAARVHLGFDEIAEVTTMFLPQAVFPSIPASGSDVVQRYLWSQPVPREGAAALRTSGRWSRPDEDRQPRTPRTTKGTLRLLLLSAGSPVAHNVIDALGSRREECVLIGTNSVAEAAGNFRCDTVHVVPPAASGATYIGRIAELIREERPDLVIPCRDDDVLALAMLREELPCANAVLLTGSEASARMMSDTVESARFAGRHDLPFVPIAGNAHEAVSLAASHGLPLLGAPRNGGRGVMILRSSTEVERAFESCADLIARPFFDAPHNVAVLVAPCEAGLPFFFSLPDESQHTVHILVGPDGEISNPFGCVNKQVGGRSLESRRCDDPGLLAVGRAYARAAAAEGWRGPLNVKLERMPDERFAAYALNGRFSGGTAARTCMGFDEVGDAVRQFLPGVAFPAIPASASDVVQKHLRSYPLPRESVTALRESGRWSVETRS